MKKLLITLLFLFPLLAYGQKNITKQRITLDTLQGRQDLTIHVIDTVMWGDGTKQFSSPSLGKWLGSPDIVNTDLGRIGIGADQHLTGVNITNTDSVGVSMFVGTDTKSQMYFDNISKQLKFFVDDSVSGVGNIVAEAFSIKGFQFDSVNGGQDQFVFSTEAEYTNDSNRYIRLHGNANNLFSVSAFDGKETGITTPALGIGTATPQALIDVVYDDNAVNRVGGQESSVFRITATSELAGDASVRLFPVIDVNSRGKLTLSANPITDAKFSIESSGAGYTLFDYSGLSTDLAINHNSVYPYLTGGIKTLGNLDASRGWGGLELAGSSSRIPGQPEIRMAQTLDDEFYILTGNLRDLDGAEQMMIELPIDPVNDGNVLLGVKGLTKDYLSLQTLNSDAALGINTITPLASLHVSLSTGGLPALNASTVAVFENGLDPAAGAVVSIFSGNATGNSQLTFGDVDDQTVGRIVYAHSNNRLRFYSNGAEQMYIDANGIGKFLKTQDFSDQTMTVSDTTEGKTWIHFTGTLGGTVTISTVDINNGGIFMIKDAGGNAIINNISVVAENSQPIDGSAAPVLIDGNFGVIRLRAKGGALYSF